jgi:V8-like Glu-specific endopeptidase
MNWDDDLIQLNQLLAERYPTIEGSARIVSRAGLQSTRINFQNSAIDNWYQILEYARPRKRVTHIINAARQDDPDDDELASIEKRMLGKARGGPVIGRDVKWLAKTSSATLEKLMYGQSTLLPIGFLELGLERARPVTMLRLPDGGAGTGFLVQNNVLITNNHVIPDPETARGTVALFNYEKDASGSSRETLIGGLDPDNGFLTSSSDPTFHGDWTLIKVHGDLNSAQGHIPLQHTETNSVQYVNIIQHPESQHKQLACYHNFVTYADDNVVQYLTDTLPGSSGSPVFDSTWNLVALHHSGGDVKQPGVTGKIFRNEGTNINRVVDAYEQYFRL